MSKPILLLRDILLLLLLCIQSVVYAQEKQARSILNVSSIQIESPVGTVPRLPYQVWVNYTDNTGEYRQVKWTNAALDTELEMANQELYPVGKEYRIQGFITGDHTTPEGFPLEAVIKVTDKPYKSPKKIIAEPLPLPEPFSEADVFIPSRVNTLLEEVLRSVNLDNA
jgi:hypothetical protein